MTPRTDYLIQILDKIGAPLVSALVRAGGDMQADAQRVASLLSRSVQMSIDIGKAMDLNMADPEAGDRFRLALMALAGPIVAAQFAANGQVPGEAEQRKIMTALEAVLTFSDNFAASQASADQLKTLEDAPVVKSEQDMTLHALRALGPVVSAVAVFPFGQPEKKLIQDIAGRLMDKAKALREAICPEAGDAEARLAELALIRSLAGLYAECHNAETGRLMQAGQDVAASGGMEAVWTAFEIRAAMLETLAVNLLPGGVKTEAALPPPAETPMLTSPAASPPAVPQGGSSPMALFAKKHPEAPAAPPAAPPAAESPPPGDSESGKEDGGGGQEGSGGGNPMSFFKKKE